MRVLGVIPARLGSTRLPNKPLLPLAGEPLVVRVAEAVSRHGLVDALVVATDSPEVANAAERAGIRAVITSRDHGSGTARVAEVAAGAEYRRYDTVLNVQGDEPFVNYAALEGALARLANDDEIGTVAAPLDPAVAHDPARVKVVTDATGRALYFSRAAIPYRRDEGDPVGHRYWQHIGIYACSRSTLHRWATLPETPAECAERLEQLRALEHGMTIGVTRLSEAVHPGIDTPDDLRRAEAHWRATEHAMQEASQ